MYLLVLLLPHEVQSNAGPHGQRSAVNVFVSVSCVFVSICKKKKKKKSFYTISTLFTVYIIWLSSFIENVFCKMYSEKCHSLMKQAER